GHRRPTETAGSDPVAVLEVVEHPYRLGRGGAAGPHGDESGGEYGQQSQPLVLHWHLRRQYSRSALELRAFSRPTGGRGGRAGIWNGERREEEEGPRQGMHMRFISRCYRQGG